MAPESWSLWNPSHRWPQGILGMGSMARGARRELVHRCAAPITTAKAGRGPGCTAGPHCSQGLWRQCHCPATSETQQPEQGYALLVLGSPELRAVVMLECSLLLNAFPRDILLINQMVLKAWKQFPLRCLFGPPTQ